MAYDTGVHSRLPKSLLSPQAALHGPLCRVVAHHCMKNSRFVNLLIEACTYDGRHR